MKRGGKPTVKDIAREAGVSPTTVSIALSDPESTRVSPETRRRIGEIAERLRYVPNRIARSLVMSESRTIGYVASTLTNPFLAEIAQDIVNCAEEHGYGVIVRIAPGDIEDERRAVNDLIQRGADGLIITSCRRHDPVVADLSRQGVPFVLTARNIARGPGAPRADYIGLDHKRGAFMAVEHLIGLGHRRIAVVVGPLETSSGYDRSEGAFAAMRAVGIEPDPSLFIETDFTRPAGREAALSLLSRPDRPSAVFVGNDLMAIGVLDALSESGLSTPDDLAVVGFDDIEMAGLPGVGLTTVSQQKTSMGRAAVERLIAKLRGEGAEGEMVHLLDPILMIRKSCGFAARRAREEAARAARPAAVSGGWDREQRKCPLQRRSETP